MQQAAAWLAREACWNTGSSLTLEEMGSLCAIIRARSAGCTELSQLRERPQSLSVSWAADAPLL